MDLRFFSIFICLLAAVSLVKSEICTFDVTNDVVNNTLAKAIGKFSDCLKTNLKLDGEPDTKESFNLCNELQQIFLPFKKYYRTQVFFLKCLNVDIKTHVDGDNEVIDEFCVTHIHNKIQWSSINNCIDQNSKTTCVEGIFDKATNNGKVTLNLDVFNPDLVCTTTRFEKGCFNDLSEHANDKAKVDEMITAITNGGSCDAVADIIEKNNANIIGKSLISMILFFAVTLMLL